MFETWHDVYLKPVTAEQIQARTGFMHDVRGEAFNLSPEAADYMALAECPSTRLAESGGRHPEVSAREAYTAALNAARAVIFHKTGKALKTHSGTRKQMHRLMHEGMRFDSGLAQFLSDGYEVKSLLTTARCKRWKWRRPQRLSSARLPS